MFAIDTRTWPQAPHRVLRPGRTLARVTGRSLRTPQYLRLERVLYLVETHFPASLADVEAISQGLYWVDAFGHFLALVKAAGWFDVCDWLLEDLWVAAQHEEDWEEDGEPMSLWYFAGFLDGIPINLLGFGPGEIGWEGADINQYPVLALLEGLVGGVGLYKYDHDRWLPKINHNLLERQIQQWREGPIYQAHTGRTCDLVVQLGVLDQLEPPLNAIPLAAQWACGETGNIVLDEYWDMNDEIWPDRWLWDQDLGLIKQMWAEAMEIKQQIEPLLLWANQDQAKLQRVYEVVTATLRGDNE